MAKRSAARALGALTRAFTAPEFLARTELSREGALALLETVEFAVLSYAMSGAAFALRRDPLWILFMVVEIRLLQRYWAALGRCLTARWARWTLAALGVAACLTAAALFGPLAVPEVPGLLG